MDPRYQIFVSSTYTDLIEERRVVMQTLLKMDCMPAGMELFPAADDSAWSVIEQVIRESDYYVLIVGGRYGSKSTDNPLSFTEREFDLATELGIPVLPFLHSDPGSIPQRHADDSDDARRQLKKFREKVEQNRLRDHWKNADELASKVVLAVTQAKKAKPRTGWIRADRAADPKTLQELERIRRENEELRTKIERARRDPPANHAQFAFGDESVPAEYFYETMNQNREQVPHVVSLLMTWTEVFTLLGPLAYTPVAESRLRGALDAAITNRDRIKSKPARFNFNVPESVLNILKTQFMALGLWELSEVSHTPEPHWRLTPYGKDVLVQLLAIPATARPVTGPTSPT